MRRMCVYDAYNIWVKHIKLAIERRGDWDFLQVPLGADIPSGSYVFLRPTMEEKQLEREKEWLKDHVRRDDITLVTDATQVLLYEDKCAQFLAFADYLPDTCLFTDYDRARDWVESHREWPIVSKAAVGASSQFVNIVDKAEALAIVNQAFGDGIPLNHQNWDRQKGYVLLQRFLPGNDFTWRVNVVGEEVAVFRRFNYPDRPVAQTGNTEAVADMTDEVYEVAEYAQSVAQDIGSKWVALDILSDFGKLRLLETSLGWPWPGVGKDAKFFPSRRPWSEMFDLMLDQIEEGVFDEAV